MGTAAGVTNFCGLHGNVEGRIVRLVRGVSDDLLGRIDRLGGLRAPHTIFGRTLAQAYDTAAYKIAADDLVLSSGAEILFHAYACGVMREADRVSALLVETKSGRRAIRGAMFIDASGDGDLAASAGAMVDKGDGDGHLLFPSTMFRMNNVDAPTAQASLAGMDALMETAARRDGRPFPRKGVIVRPQKNAMEWRANVTQVTDAAGRAVDATDARSFSDGEIEGRRQVERFAKFLVSDVPGFQAAYIVDIPPQLGVRETRRIRGHHVLTGAEVIDCATSPASIGLNGWPLEEHVAGDVRWTWAARPRGCNDLPWPMLVPLGLDNVLVAGRCASMDHRAHAAARVSGPCFVMGQAAATGAVQALQAKCRPIDIDVAALQAQLRREGVLLDPSEAVSASP
jgi:hypothetical protein